MSNACVVWGTGSLSDKFLQREWPFTPVCFVDPVKTGEFAGYPIVAPEELGEMQFDLLVVSSSFVSEIVTRLVALKVDLSMVRVFKSSVRELVPLSEYVEITGQRHYHLPWKNQLSNIHNSLSSDIVFADVYKELAKSVGYAHIASVEGDFAEFGTCSGYTASLISYAVNYYGEHLSKHDASHGQAQRKLHLFDSFEGFPESTKQVDLDSPHVLSGAWGEGTAKGLSEKELLSLCSIFLDRERIQIYPGWYKDTLSTISKETKLAFVHIDCDLYESTIDVLNHLFSNNIVSQGAVLLFDNWFCNKASPEFGEQKAWSDICKAFEIEFTNLGMYACVGNRMIVHSYKKRTV